MDGAGRMFRRLRVVHPFPSAINAALVFGLARLAAADWQRSFVLAGAMLGLQFAIGALNDFVDRRVDARAKPWKAIPSGLLEPRTALAIGVLSGGGALLLAGSLGPAVALMAGAMLLCGVAYDLWLKPTPLAWACFSVAFAILPVYAWFGASGELLPRAEFLLPLAALAGPLIQLANGLADLERDRDAGLATLAVRLGRRASLAVIAILLVFIHGVAWLTLPAAPGSVLPVSLASGLGLLAVVLSAASRPAAREVGWMLQAVSVALLGVGWLAAVA